MASVLKVDKLDPQSGTALEIGTSGDTVTVPSGVGLTLTDSTLLLPTTITSTTEVKTNKVSPATGTAFALGDSGDTFTVPSGATLDISASTLTPPATMPASSGVNLTALNATNLGSGTVPTARLGTGSASSSVFLAGDSTWIAAGGNNTPAFQAKLSANQNPSGSTWTTIAFNTELYDSDGCYDNSSTYAFTPTTAGKYFVYWSVVGDISTVPSLKNISTRVRKNGSGFWVPFMSNNDNNWVNITSGASTVVDMNGSSDYLDVQGYIIVSSGANYFLADSYFGAYLLIGA